MSLLGLLPPRERFWPLFFKKNRFFFKRKVRIRHLEHCSKKRVEAK
nr:MAG TPA: hypothetical protein [Caudoviricetes sp.]